MQLPVIPIGFHVTEVILKIDCINHTPILQLKLWKDELDPGHVVTKEKLQSIIQSLYTNTNPTIEMTHD